MKRFVPLGFTIAAAVLALGAQPAAAQTSGHDLVKIEQLGREAPQVKRPGDGTFTTLRMQDPHLPDGSRVLVPPRATVVFKSNGRHENVTTLLPGTDYTFNTTDPAEQSTIHRGNALFSVISDALSFFHVGDGKKVSASVRGTEFSVSLSVREMAFDVRRGRVDVERHQKVEIAHQRAVIRTIRVVSEKGAVTTGVVVAAAPTARVIDVIPKGQMRRYRVDGSEDVRTYSTPAQVYAEYERQLEAVLADRDAGPERRSAAYNNRGIARQETGDPNGAVGDYGQAITLDPHDAVAYYNRGSVRAQLGALDLAIEDYNEAIHLNAGDASAYNNRGTVWLRKGGSLGYRKAMEDFNRALRYDGKNAAALTNRGFEYYANGDTRAAGDYDAALTLDPKNSYAFNNRAIDFLNKHLYDRALEDLNAALRLDDSNTAAYYNRGLEYERRGDLNHAIDDYSKAIELDPNLVAAYNRRGMAKSVKNDEAAIKDYAEAVRRDKNYAAAYNNRGAAYRRQGKYDLAIADFTKALELDRKLGAAYVSRGLAYSAVGKYDSAIDDYTQAISIEANPGLIYGYRGTAYLNAAHPNDGNAARAEADLGHAAALVPNNAYIALWREIADRRGGQPSHLAQAETKLDMTAWPAPLVRLFRGEIDPAAALAAARDPDPAKQSGHVCQANFYTAELMRLRRNDGEARRLYGVAARDCPPGFAESKAANAELLRPK